MAWNELLYIIGGLLTGALVLVTLMCYELQSDVYGYLTVPLELLLIALSVVAFLITDVFAGGIEGKIIPMISLVICIWLLLVTSYMDQRNGDFWLFPLVIALVVELVLLVLYCLMGHIAITMQFIQWFVGLHVLLFILSIKGYSKGDLGVLYVCMYTFVMVCGPYFVWAVFVNLFVALLTFLIRNITRMRQKVLPFNMYIAIGAYVALYLYGS